MLLHVLHHIPSTSMPALLHTSKAWARAVTEEWPRVCSRRFASLPEFALPPSVWWAVATADDASDESIRALLDVLALLSRDWPGSVAQDEREGINNRAQVLLQSRHHLRLPVDAALLYLLGISLAVLSRGAAIRRECMITPEEPQT